MATATQRPRVNVVGIPFEAPSHCSPQEFWRGVRLLTRGLDQLQTLMARVSEEGKRPVTLLIHTIEAVNAGSAYSNGSDIAQAWRSSAQLQLSAAIPASPRSTLAVEAPFCVGPLQFGEELPWIFVFFEVYHGPPGSQDDQIALSVDVASAAAARVGGSYLSAVLEGAAHNLDVLCPAALRPVNPRPAAFNLDWREALLKPKNIHLLPSRILPLPASSLDPTHSLYGSAKAIAASIIAHHIGYAELAEIKCEWEDGVLATGTDLVSALQQAHPGPQAQSLPRVRAFLQGVRQRAGLGARTGGLDGHRAGSQAAFIAAVPGRSANLVGMSNSIPLEPVAGPGVVHVPALPLANPFNLPAPGAGLLFNGLGVASLLLLIFLGLHAGDGHVSQNRTFSQYGTALFEAQLHFFMAMLCVGPNGWRVRVRTRFVQNGGGGGLQAGTIRCLVYSLVSTFSDAAAAALLAHYLSSGDHHMTFAATHRNNILAYMAGLNLQHAAAAFLLGTLMSDGTQRVGPAAGSRRLDLCALDAGGNIYVAFVTCNMEEALLFVELLRRLGIPNQLPNPTHPTPTQNLYSVRVTGRMNVGRLLRCFLDALDAINAAAAPALVASHAAATAGQPLPPLDRPTIAVIAQGLLWCRRDLERIATTPNPAGCPVPPVYCVLPPCKSDWLQLMIEHGAVPACPDTIRVVRIVLPAHEHVLMTALVWQSIGRAREEMQPPLLRVNGRGGDMVLLVAAAPAHSTAVRRAQGDLELLRVHTAATARNAASAAVSTVIAQLPLSLTDPRTIPTRQAFDASMQSAVAAAGNAWLPALQQQQQQPVREEAWFGAVLPQDTTGGTASGSGTGPSVPDYGAQRVADHLQVPPYTGQRGNWWTQKMVDALRIAYEWDGVRFGGSGGLGTGGGQIAGALVAVTTLVCMMWALPPRALHQNSFYGHHAYLTRAHDAPFWLLWQGAMAFMAAKIVWGLRGRVTLPLRFVLGAPAAYAALFSLLERVSRAPAPAPPAPPPPFPRRPIVPVNLLPDRLMGGTTNAALASADTQSRLPTDVVVLAGSAQGACGSGLNRSVWANEILGATANVAGVVRDALNRLPPLQRPSPSADLSRTTGVNTLAYLMDGASMIWTHYLGNASQLPRTGVNAALTITAPPDRRVLVVGVFPRRGLSARARRRARRFADHTLYGVPLAGPHPDLPADLRHSLTGAGAPDTVLGFDDAGQGMMVSMVANFTPGSSGTESAFDHPPLAMARAQRVSFMAVAKWPAGWAGVPAGGGAAGAGGAGGAAGGAAGAGGGAGGAAGAGGGGGGGATAIGADPNLFYPPEVLADDYRLLAQWPTILHAVTTINYPVHLISEETLGVTALARVLERPIYITPGPGESTGPLRVHLQIEEVLAQSSAWWGSAGPLMHDQRDVWVDVRSPMLQPLLPADAHAEVAARRATPLPRQWPAGLDWDTVLRDLGVH